MSQIIYSNIIVLNIRILLRNASYFSIAIIIESCDLFESITHQFINFVHDKKFISEPIIFILHLATNIVENESMILQNKGSKVSL